MTIALREATPADVPLLLELIRELAEYERLAGSVVADERGLHEALFGPRPSAEAILAEAGEEPAGFALYFHNFSTFAGRPGLYLEDLYVRERWRGRGIGRRLLLHLARTAARRGCGRMEWAVLDWNRPAIEFYRRLGAVPLSDWTLYRLGREQIETLAEEAED